MSDPSNNPLANVMATEQINPRTVDIDLLATEAVLQKINAEDRLVADAVQEAIPHIAVVVDKVTEAFLNKRRLFYFGAGTSGRLGVLDASECPPTYGADPTQVQGIIAGGDTALRTAVEGAEDSEELGRADVQKHNIQPGDVVVGISASGHAPYVHGVLKQAKEQGAFTAAITCHDQSGLIPLVDQPIVVNVGPEVVAGSTRMKAGTAQKLVLNMITTSAMIQSGKTYQNLMVDVQPNNSKLIRRAQRIVAALAKVSVEEAKAALEKTNYQVKPAVLVLCDTISPDEAHERLAEVNGKLRLALEKADTIPKK